MKSLALSLTLATTLAAPAFADGEYKIGATIRDGLEGWFGTDTASVIEDSISVGYVIGIHDALSGTDVCTPSDLQQGELLEVVLSFMNEHRDRLGESADSLVIEALTTRWGCERE